MSRKTAQRPERTKRWAARPALPRMAGYALFFLTLFVPTKYQPIKIALLLIAVIAVLVQISLRRVSLRPRFFLPILFFVALGLAYVLYGAYRDNPGASAVAPVYVAWPLAYLFLVLGVSEPRHLRALVRVMVFAGIAIGGYGCAYVLASEGRLPGWILKISISQGQIFYSPGVGQTTASFTTLSTLLFLLPFLMTMLIAWPHGRPPVRRVWIFISAALCLALAALSARSALVLAVALTPIVILLLAKISLRRIVPLGLAVLGFAAVIVAFGVNVGSVVTSLQNSFNTSSDTSAEIRSSEWRALLTGFESHPIFGSGLGSVAPNFIRDPVHPWAYELSYAVLLFNVGIVGVVCYGFGLAWVSLRAFSLRRDPVVGGYAVAVSVGLVSFLIGNITNPYLTKYDSLWVLFFPLAIVNVALTQRERTDASGSDQPATRPRRPAAATAGRATITDKIATRQKTRLTTHAVTQREKITVPPPTPSEDLAPEWREVFSGS